MSLHQHSASEMGAVRHRVTYHQGRIVPWNEEATEEQEQEAEFGNGGASYLNEYLDRALQANKAHAVVPGRTWEIYKSASVTATKIRQGKIPGPHWGRSFEAAVMPSIDVPGEWCVKIRGIL